MRNFVISQNEMEGFFAKFRLFRLKNFASCFASESFFYPFYLWISKKAKFWRRGEGGRAYLVVTPTTRQQNLCLSGQLFLSGRAIWTAQKTLLKIETHVSVWILMSTVWIRGASIWIRYFKKLAQHYIPPGSGTLSGLGNTIWTLHLIKHYIYTKLGNSPIFRVSD